MSQLIGDALNHFRDAVLSPGSCGPLNGTPQTDRVRPKRKCAEDVTAGADTGISENFGIAPERATYSGQRIRHRTTPSTWRRP